MTCNECIHRRPCDKWHEIVEYFAEQLNEEDFDFFDNSANGNPFADCEFYRIMGETDERY